MSHRHALATISGLTETSHGVFRVDNAVRLGVTPKQIAALRNAGVIERVLPSTYRITAVPRSSQQSLSAALLWAGPDAIAGGRSAAEIYGLEGVHAPVPEIIVRRRQRLRSNEVVVHRSDDRGALRTRRYRGFAVTGVEPTLVALAAMLGGEAFEIACEDARRRNLTSMPALRAHLARYGGRAGAARLRASLDELDPVHAARSTLEVKTRRLLVAHGIRSFVREFPLTWNNRRYLFDFGFERERTILETNGRRWHDDPNDFEHDHEKWSVPGRHGYRIVLATWDKVTRHPGLLLSELTTTLAA
ncbi:MAG TPA: type IV toxin-antitoxin system AbiEi family antitoxin domain-containing protein [Acidimicrobiia bacterium]|nr:type IV toxin-antitoxin system AbiEi family antitoxin domain-containing protein [Acidimicrobiia bacterium]